MHLITICFGLQLSKLAGPLMKVAVLLTKNILAPLGITAAVKQLVQEFKKKKKREHGLGTITLINSNEEMNDLMKIVQALEDSNILLKRVTKTIESCNKVL